MLIGHDHPIFIVANPADLDSIADGFVRLGFSISRRDDDDASTSPTENRLICFADGSYIEILTIRDEEHRRKHRFAEFLSAGDGWIDYAIHTDSLLEDQKRLTASGAATNGPLRHARQLRNGPQWAVSLVLAGIGAGPRAMPFLVQDESERRLRVPDQRIRHANGVTGVTGVAITVTDLGSLVSHFTALFGSGAALPHPYEGACDGRRHEFNSRWVDVIQVGAGRSVLRDHLEHRGEGIFEVTFSRASSVMPPRLDASIIGGARIRVIDTG